MTDWADNKIEKENSRFIENAIKLSHMVSKHIVNSSIARIIFSELYDGHKRNLAYIKQIDQLF